MATEHRNAVVVGLQWGDEGKGKVVDILAPRSRWVVRFQGGNNAGHTLVVEGRTIVMHLVPSGILHAGPTCVIGNGVVVDPEVLVSEMDALAARGIGSGPDRILVAADAHVIMPYHRELDRCREEALGNRRIGTTGRGIGPAYEDKVARRGIRVRDLVVPERLGERLEIVLAEKNRMIGEWYGGRTMTADAISDWARPLAQRLLPHMTETAGLLQRATEVGEPILFEGAQGTFLDVDHGTYPFVTSSNTVAGAACAGSGVGPREIHAVVGVAKAYATRVGSGPFPTELLGPEGERLREKGREFGATTGRPRRCGWFDAALAKQAVRLNGATHVALTKLDVLGGLGALRIGVRMEGWGEVPGPHRIEPVYEELPGWEEDISGCRRWEELPPACRAYVERIEALVGVPVGLVSVGPGREQNIVRDRLFD